MTTARDLDSASSVTGTVGLTPNAKLATPNRPAAAAKYSANVSAPHTMIATNPQILRAAFIIGI